MKSTLVLFTIFTSLLAMAPAEVGASARDVRITEILLSEGNSLRQSRVESLLEMIRAGESWDEYDNWRAYENLERFTPYSEEASLKILNLILQGLAEANSHIDIERLLLSLKLAGPQLVSPKVEKLLLQVMRELNPSQGQAEEKRLAAVALMKSPSGRAEAIECLRQLIQGDTGNSSLEVLAAFNLMQAGVLVGEAESVLIKNIESPHGLSAVMYFGSESFANVISEPLLQKMRAAIDPLPDGRSRALALRQYEKIALRGKQNPLRENLSCQKILDGESAKILSFPR